MNHISRRDMVQVLAAATGAVAFDWTPGEAARAAVYARRTGAANQGYEPAFFTPHEWQVVNILVDIIIPRDERSGSATDASVPKFIDFIMMDGDNEQRQTAMRGGLAWLDTECRERYGKDFVDCTESEGSAVLDDVAWPARARPELGHGVRFFSSFRDLTASGFWTSRMGIEDLAYLGNTAVPEWAGCPEEQLDRLGVSYE